MRAMRTSALSFFVVLLITDACFAEPPAVSPAKLAAEARAQLDKNNAATPPAVSIEFGRPRRVEASLAFVAAAPRMVPKSWTVVGPVPPVLASQRDITIESTPKAERGAEATPPARPFLVWRITPAEEPPKKHVTVGMTYSIELVSRTLASKPPAAPVAPLSDGERTLFSAPGGLADYESPAVQAWLAERGLRPKAKETDVDFARRLFLDVKDSADFEYVDRMDRRASAVCKAMKSDCGGLTALFVAACRANGIPARQLIGRWAESAEKDEKLHGMAWQKEHVKAEFFAAGVGWVPVDLSVAVDLDRRPGSLRHFGRDNADFITMHVDPDVRVEMDAGRRTTTFLQEPIFTVRGTGTMAGAQARSDWEVKGKK